MLMPMPRRYAAIIADVAAAADYAFRRAPPCR